MKEIFLKRTLSEMFDKFLNTPLALMFKLQIEKRTVLRHPQETIYKVHLLLVKDFHYNFSLQVACKDT